MWKQYNPNPTGRNIEDCAIRAVAKALGTDWDTAFMKIAVNAFQMGDVMADDADPRTRQAIERMIDRM